MNTYTITAVADTTRDWSTRSGAAMKSYRVTLRNKDGREKENVEVSRAASAPVPKPGDELQGEVKQTDYGPKLQEPRQMGGGAGRAKPPEERRSISMQSSLSRGIDAVRLAIDAGWVPTPATPEAVTEAALRAADRFFERVQRAERGET